MRNCFMLFIAITLSMSNANAQNANQSSYQIILKVKDTYACQLNENTLSIGLPVLDNLGKTHQLQSIKNTVNSSPTRPMNNRPNTDNRFVLTFEEDANISEIITAYQQTGTLEYVEPNGRIYGAALPKLPNPAPVAPNDPHFNRQYWAVNDGSFNLTEVGSQSPPAKADADIDLDQAWEITTGCSNVTLAILDTGCKLDHPEFAGRIVSGYDYVNGDNDPTDDNGHGTNVTGIAAATGNNNIGYAGVDWNCKIMPVKILDQNNGGNVASIVSALYFAVDNGADVINLSLVADANYNDMETAIQYAYDNNVVVISAMGNVDAQKTFYPAAYSTTIAIGSTDTDDTRMREENINSGGSSYGSHIDICAPGCWIYGLDYYDDNEMDLWFTGTSMATPVVSGTVTLLKCLNPSLKIEEIREILRATAEDNVGLLWEDVTGFDSYHGAGRLNAYQALLYLACQNGLACDDGNPSTINDVYQEDCNCQGTNIPAQLSMQVYLQGAMLGSPDSNTMRTDLMAQNLIPLTEPYTDLTAFTHVNNGGGETTDTSILTNYEIVDWLLLELRDANDSSKVIATKSVLLQKDGTVIDAGGKSLLEFTGVPMGMYYVAVRHRNHLGIMTKNAVLLDGNLLMDFTDSSTTWGSDPCAFMSNGKQILWAGNMSPNDNLIFEGSNNDQNEAFFSVLSDTTNSEGFLNYVINAYHLCDTNLDGLVIYQGLENDMNVIFFNVLSAPNNTEGFASYILKEQLPGY